jgi:hypothetical protein
MRWIVVACFVLACRDKPPVANVEPATDDQAVAFATRLVAASTPTCDEAKLDAMIDHDALAVKVGDRTHAGAKKQDVIATVVAKRHSGVKVLCAWLGSGARFKVMNVTNARPLVRKLFREGTAKAQGVAYFKFELGKSRADGVVRMVDAYAFIEGAWLTELLAQVVDATLESGAANTVRETMEAIKRLRAEHKGTEALAMVEKLPDEVKKLRSVQMMRAGIARQISMVEYGKALDELERQFPDDPSVAILEIDGAILHKNYDAALAKIDVIDKAVGGDPFQEAVRSGVYFQKGDLPAAAAHADAAIQAEPTLERAWMAKLDVMLATTDWPSALDAIDHLAKLGTMYTDAEMRAAHAFDGLVASPEYATWHAAHP